MPESNDLSVFRNIAVFMGTTDHPDIHVWVCDDSSVGETVSDIISRCQEGAFSYAVAVKMAAHLIESALTKLEED